MTRVTPFGAGVGLMAVAAIAALLVGCESKPPASATELPPNIQKAWQFKLDGWTYDVIEFAPASHPGMTCSVVNYRRAIAQSCFPKQTGP